jgi:hypothetical protein
MGWARISARSRLLTSDCMTLSHAWISQPKPIKGPNVMLWRPGILLIIIKGETLYANDEYVRLPNDEYVRLPTVTLQRFHIFEICFQHSTYGVICRFKFVFWRNRTVPSRSTVKGHISFKYIAPNVTYRWKGLVKSLPTIFNLWTLWPLYDLQGRFWGQSSTPSCEVSLERSCQQLSNDA